MNQTNKTPRIMIAGTHSGCGKTTVTCGILKYLVDQGKRARSFKCGPDYIDPMFHRKVIGTEAGNLDLFMTDENTVKYLLHDHDTAYDITVVEGVMGFYDGLNHQGDPSYASSFHLSRTTATPVVLIVNGRGMAQSILAMIKGYLKFQPNLIKGVILNQVSKAVFDQLKEAIETELGLTALGYIPSDTSFKLESRHLGLVTANEVENLNGMLSKLAEQLAQTIDFNKLLAIGALAEPLSFETPDIPLIGNGTRIAVAMDQAFCFYYRENLTLFQQMGAELCYFSPLAEEHLPVGTGGLILGGGYPELYLEKLSANSRMKEEIHRALSQGMPCIAECGGFMYLMDKIEEYNMVGVIPGKAALTEKLVRFGYVTLTADHDNLLCSRGDTIRGHEFHYSDSSDNGCSFTAEKKNGQIQYPCIHGNEHLYAGYPHLNFWGNRKFAENFVASCKRYQEGRK